LNYLRDSMASRLQHYSQWPKIAPS
jgi:hypothetical protein